MAVGTVVPLTLGSDLPVKGVGGELKVINKASLCQLLGSNAQLVHSTDAFLSVAAISTKSGHIKL